MEVELTKEERERLEKASEESSKIFEKYGLQGFSFVALKEKGVSSLVSAIDGTVCDIITQLFGYNLFKMHQLYFKENLPTRMKSAMTSIMLGTEFCKKLLTDDRNFVPFFQKSPIAKSQLN